MNKYVRFNFPNNIKPKIESLGLGVFDGMHLGHQAISCQCDALLTFYPHPALVLGKKSNLLYLTTISEMRHFVPSTIQLEFNAYISQLSANDFLDQVVLNTLNPKKIVVGYDFKYGCQQQGNIVSLKEWGEQHNVDIVVVDPVMDNEKPIKSSLIRSYLDSGDLNQVVSLLGHPYLIEGHVIKGDGRGNTLGYPTANLEFSSQKFIPKNGVYRGFCQVNHQRYQAMIYIGTKPTFDQSSRGVEVFLRHFSDNLYNQSLQVFIQDKVRNEIKFTNSQELKNQIQTDITNAFSD